MPAKLIYRTHADGEKVFYKKYTCENRIHPHLQLVETHLEDYLLQNLDLMLHNLVIEVKTREKGIDGSIKKKKRLEGKLERLREVYIDGDMDKEIYQARKKALEEEINSIYIPQSIMPDVPDNWKEIYKDLTEERKAVFWKRIIKTIEATNDTKKNPKVIFL